MTLGCFFVSRVKYIFCIRYLRPLLNFYRQVDGKPSNGSRDGYPYLVMAVQMDSIYLEITVETAIIYLVMTVGIDTTHGHFQNWLQLTISILCAPKARVSQCNRVSAYGALSATTNQKNGERKKNVLFNIIRSIIYCKL